MPDIVMTQAESVVTCETDVTNQIKALIECMDNADLLPDGFSDYDDSSNDDEHDHIHLSMSYGTKNVLESEKRLSQSLSLKTGLFDRSLPRSIYRSISKPSDPKHDNHHQTFKHSKSANNILSLTDETENKNKHEKHSHTSKETTPRHHFHHRHKHHHNHQTGRHHPQHHSRHSNKGHDGKHSNNSNTLHDSDSEMTTDEKDTSGETFDVEALAPIRAGQSDDDVNLPIMTPPPPDTRDALSRCSSSYYRRPMSLKILFAGETIKCTFDFDDVAVSTKKLLSSSMKNNSVPDCFCSSTLPSSYRDSFCGWETNKKQGRVKTAKRRRNARHNDASFNRLTQHTGKDPVIFHHYKDTKKYIERYRFYHTISNAGRPLSYTSYEDKVPGTDPYYSKMKSNLSSVMNAQMYTLAAQMRDDKDGSASSEESVQERPRSDDESNEGSGVDVKTCSMRDRGKALNLAPVRECTVPNLTPTDKINIMQLNQYLNLSTPPMSSDCLDFELDDVKAKRYGYRLSNDSTCNIFATSGARRKSRPLRLGSAEFVKPGTAESATGKWSSEKRPTQKSATNTLSTVSGNLIVGSTVSPIPAQPVRVRSSGNMPPYVQFQRDNLIHYQQSSLQQVSGQKVRTCERLIDTPASSKERGGKFSFTHAETSEKLAQPLRTATAVDFRETYTPRRSRTITLDINHLGIRGQPLKQSEQMVLYKNRRAQIVRS